MIEKIYVVGTVIVGFLVDERWLLQKSAVLRDNCAGNRAVHFGGGLHTLYCAGFGAAVHHLTDFWEGDVDQLAELLLCSKYYV